MGKDMDFVSQWLVHKGLDKLAEIFRGEFLSRCWNVFQCFIEATF